MRVLITRPEREATTLAAALAERGHAPVLAPLFRLEILRPPADFAATLAASQAVLLSSANGARALAESNEQRGKPILAVGDTTASTAEGLGFASVVSASGDGAALADLARRRLDPKAGPLLHVAGAEVAQDFAAALAPDGFEVRRVALYDAREETTLPDSARAALQARALDAATFFSPRAADLFVRLVQEAGLSGSLAGVTAIAISPAALQPLSGLPFRATVAAARPTRQAVLDEIDRLATAGVEGPSIMSDTPSPSDTPPPAAAAPVQVRHGVGVIGAFITGIVAACLVLASALISLPYWPAEVRVLWRGEAAPPPPPAPALDLQAVRRDAAAVANAAVEAAKRELTAKLDDLEKRVRAASAAAAERPAAAPDPAIADLRAKIAALESHSAPAAAPSAAPTADQEKELAALRLEITTLRTALQTLDQAMVGQRDQAKALAEAVDKARGEAGARGTSDQKVLAAARASAVIGLAARLNAALEAGLPFAADLDLLAPLAQGDAKLGDIIKALQPYGQNGVASRATLVAGFPAVAKAALAEDLADDSFGERLLGKLRSLVSLRRVGADVQGDSVEAKLARAEAALDAGDLAKAVEIVKTLPPQTARATAGWLSGADAHLAARRAVDQLAAQAVAQLGAAR